MDIKVNVQWTRRADNGRVLVAKQLLGSVGDMTLGGHKLSDAGIAKMLEYGLTQFVADGYAAKKDETVGFDDAKERAEARIDALISGDFTSRGSDGRGSHRNVVVKASLDNPKRADDKAAFGKVDAKEAAKWLNDYFAKQGDDYKAAVEALVDARIEAAKASKVAALDL